MALWFSENGERVYGDGKTSVDPGQRLLTWKPEVFWIEIADLCIRLADTMGAYGWAYSPPARVAVFTELPDFIGELHQ